SARQQASRGVEFLGCKTNFAGKSCNRFPFWSITSRFPHYLYKRRRPRKRIETRNSATLVGVLVPSVMKAHSIPRATYRLQLNRDFTFAQATAIVPYLAQLGISHCYISPCLKAGQAVCTGTTLWITTH